jgi:hypothetical protein
METNISSNSERRSRIAADETIPYRLWHIVDLAGGVEPVTKAVLFSSCKFMDSLLFSFLSWYRTLSKYEYAGSQT